MSNKEKMENKLSDDFLTKHIDEFMELSLEDKEIVSNKLLDIWIDEKIDAAEKAIKEEPATIISMPSGGLKDIHGKALILAMLLHDEQQVRENEVFEVVEQVLFDLVHYIDERKDIIFKLSN